MTLENLGTTLCGQTKGNIKSSVASYSLAFAEWCLHNQFTIPSHNKWQSTKIIYGGTTYTGGELIRLYELEKLRSQYSGILCQPILDEYDDILARGTHGVFNMTIGKWGWLHRFLIAEMDWKYQTDSFGNVNSVILDGVMECTWYEEDEIVIFRAIK